MENANPNPQNNTDPQKVLEEARAAYDALAREGDNLGAEKQRIQEEQMGRSMDEALANGDVQGAIASGLLDMEALEQRERELPYRLAVAEVAMYLAQARVYEADRVKFEEQLEPAARLLKPALEALEEAQAHYDQVSSHYQYLEESEDRMARRRGEAEEMAENIRKRGPSAAPIGGMASPLGEAVERRTSLRNLRRPQRD